VRGGLARLFAAAHHFGHDQRREDADDGDDQQHFDEGEGAQGRDSAPDYYMAVGGASYTSPHFLERFASQGLAELAPPKVLDFDFHKFRGFI